MIMLHALILTVVFGQCPSTESVYVKPPLYLSYNLGGMTEQSRCMAIVTYDDGRRWRVPIINGYVPSVTHTRYLDGSERYHFDYRINLTYDDWLEKRRQKEIASLPGPALEPEPEKRPAPLIRVIPDSEKEPAPLIRVLPKPDQRIPILELPRVPQFPSPQDTDLPEPKRRIVPSYDR
jgi:hypothetical protein